ncbi:MAG: flagellar hook-basal body complex protein FliE [Desulfomonilia bacterium]|nr:flagellar hook-basal body complex protein FliE [Desulfomonilia bacterium]
MRIDQLIGFSGGISPAQAPGNTQKTTFMDTLQRAFESTNDMIREADKAAVDLSSGKTPNIHEAMLAMQKADITLRLMVSATNKLIEGYNELTRLR